MTPAVCLVKHDPEAGTYGDCVRACVASILDLDAGQVPHFMCDNPSDEIARDRMTLFLATRGLAPFVTAFPGSIGRDELLHVFKMQNPSVHYMLFGQTAEGGEHVVVCKGDQVVHDPAWYSVPLVSAGRDGHWVVMVLAHV